MIYNEERKVGKKAEQMLETALLSKIGGAFKNHYRGERSKKNMPLSESSAYAGVRKWQVSDGDTIHFLNKVVIRMSQHGFIQHYGIDNTLREGRERTRHKPKTTTYSFANHYMNMEAKPFISSAVEESGVVDYVIRSLAQIRGKQILVSTGHFSEMTGNY